MKGICSENKSGCHGLGAVQRDVRDEVNRLKSLCGTSEGARYEYRADGMRVMKIADLTISWNPDDTELGSGFYDEILSVNKPTTRYFYDGQMPMEEDFKITGGFGTPTVTVTQYGLGARGIDYIRDKVGNDPETIVFPIYDGHGNMVYTLSRAANETFSLGNKRIYGVWGDLRYDGNPNAGPNTQYCANLGHKKDNESGLTYMRARYYEPWTGRFISEDPAIDGWNWHIYGHNMPTANADPSGRASRWPTTWFAIGMTLVILALIRMKPLPADVEKYVPPEFNFKGSYALAMLGLFCMTVGSYLIEHDEVTRERLTVIGLLVTGYLAIVGVMTVGAEVGMKTIAWQAVLGVYSYGLWCLAEIISQDARAILDFP